MKKMYETCWEVINLCANNQMRDVFFDEVEVEDPEEFIKQKFKDKYISGIRLQKSEHKK